MSQMKYRQRMDHHLSSFLAYPNVIVSQPHIYFPTNALQTIVKLCLLRKDMYQTFVCLFLF